MLIDPLFEELYKTSQYRYSVIVTNTKYTPEVVWKMYRERANCENIIKELKEEFGVDSFCMKSFAGTEAALNLAILAYNLISFFKDNVLRTEKTQMMKAIRYKILNIGSELIRMAGKKILRLAIKGSRRKWFIALWNTDFAFG